MPFSRLFLILIAVGIIPIILGSFVGLSFYAFILYNFLLILLLIVDIFITPSTKNIEVLRECEEKFSLGADNTIVFCVRNTSNCKLSIELTDEIPEFFNVKNRFVMVLTEAFGEVEGTYTVIPLKRGEFKFGNIHIRYDGVLRLCNKRGIISANHDYKVYPNLKDLRKYSLAALKKNQLISGVRKVKGFGLGTEFENLREYNDGDDYRKINWPATARTSKLIINTYEPERNQQIVILLDSSRVMNSEINYIKKLDYAINSAFVLTDFALKKSDNVGLLVFDSQVRRFVKTGKGGAQFGLIAENLYNVEENLVTANYNEALRYLCMSHKRRSLLCIFTELFNVDDALSLVVALKTIAKNHIPLIITIKDMRVYDEVEKEIETNDEIFLKAAAIKLIEERERIKKVFADSGIACMDIPPDMLTVEVLNKYISMKASMQI